MQPIIPVLLLMFAFSAALSSQTVLSDRNGVAVKGYDVVAYFTEEKPVKGSAKISAEHEDVLYYFSTEEHRQLFLESPEKYLPEYGGYCAYAVAKGSTAGIQPHLWTVHDNRLFLNFSNSTQRTFTANLRDYIDRADKNWAGIKTMLENRKRRK